MAHSLAFSKYIYKNPGHIFIRSLSVSCTISKIFIRKHVFKMYAFYVRHEKRKFHEAGWRGMLSTMGNDVYMEKVITKTHFVHNIIVISNTLY